MGLHAHVIFLSWPHPGVLNIAGLLPSAQSCQSISNQQQHKLRRLAAPSASMMLDSHAILLSWSRFIVLCKVAPQRFLAAILWCLLLLTLRAAVAVEVQERLDGYGQTLFDLYRRDDVSQAVGSVQLSCSVKGCTQAAG